MLQVILPSMSQVANTLKLTLQSNKMPLQAGEELVVVVGPRATAAMEAKMLVKEALRVQGGSKGGEGTQGDYGNSGTQSGKPADVQVIPT